MVIQFALANNSGFAFLRVTTPTNLALRGLQFFVQAAVLDCAANGFGGLSLSQGVQLVVGD